MRPVRTITDEEDNCRIVRKGPFETLKRDSVEPEPIGTIVLMAFKVTGYDPDCDGSLMARLVHIDKNGEETGWEENAIGLYSHSDLVVTPEELLALFEGNAPCPK